MAGVIGINVPKNIWGRMKINDNPVAAPGLFAMDAVIRPKPTEHIDRNIIKMKADKNPKAPPTGLKPKSSEKTITIITCNNEIIVFDII